MEILVLAGYKDTNLYLGWVQGQKSGSCFGIRTKICVLVGDKDKNLTELNQLSLQYVILFIFPSLKPTGSLIIVIIETV